MQQGSNSGSAANLRAAFGESATGTNDMTLATSAATGADFSSVSLRPEENSGTAMPTSFLNLLSSMVVHSRTGRLFTSTQLNKTGDALLFNTPCGITRFGCFVLPYDHSWIAPDLLQTQSSGRLSLVIDSLWVQWPSLSAQQLHTLMAGCTQDLGDPGVDPMYGQGLLDLSCLVSPAGSLRLPAGVQGVSGALYGASTAGTALTAYDAYGRDFEHRVLHRNLQARPAFDPAHNAMVHRLGDFLELTANERIASAWLIKRAAGNLHLGIGAAYEGDSLFGMSGSGHFAIYDGRSLGMRLELDQPLAGFWNMRLSLAHYKGTASAAYPGAVSDLALEQSNASITFERRFAHKANMHVKAACSSGNSGFFNSFGTRIALFGANNCSHSIGAQIRW